MATQSKSTASNPITESIESAVDRATEVNERLVERGKKVREAAVDSYETSVLALLDSYEKAASKSKIDWVPTVAAAQAGFTRELTKAYASAARDLAS
jgi:hypothetical protein